MKRSYYLLNVKDIHRKDSSFQIAKYDGTLKYFPVEDVEDFYVFSEIKLNNKLLVFLSQQKIPMHFFNYYEYYAGTFFPRDTNVSGHLLVNQVQHYSDETKRLEIAKKLIDGASSNMFRNVRYYSSRDRDLTNELKSIESRRHAISRAHSVQELMGIEGNIRREYYQSWNQILLNQTFEKRERQPPRGLVNILISFLNSLLYTKVLSEIYHTQLNPTISFLHEPGDRRFSLSLDISEIFKPLLVDRLIFRMLNRKQISDADLDNAQVLSDAAVRTILGEFDGFLNTTIKHPGLNRKVSYQRLIRLEAYKLVKQLLGDQAYEPFTIWW